MNIKSNTPRHQDKPLLTTFLHELTIARRQLALYPSDHPHIKSSVEKTLELLDQLFLSEPVITLGISPDALLFEQTWLDQDEQINREFAAFCSALGIANISFHKGLNDAELIRFSQLLRSDRSTLESFGGFEALLEQQHIDHIKVIPIDYAAFQAASNAISGKEKLWETFLIGLQQGTLDFGSAQGADFATIAELIEQRPEAAGESVTRFLEQRLSEDNFARCYNDIDRKFNTMLKKLSPTAQEQVFNSIFNVLEENTESAPKLLKKLPSHLLQETLASRAKQHTKISSRLLALASSIAEQQDSNIGRTVRSSGTEMSSDVVRARLSTLFDEERHDLYIPGNYQTALQQMLGDEIHTSMPAEQKQQLKEQMETQPIEHNFIYILLEMLKQRLSPDQELAVQQNLLDQSHFFLSCGDFTILRMIYQQWSGYLYTSDAGVSIFDEKVLASHTQASFMDEVIDAFDIYPEEDHLAIIDYIVSIGEPWSDLIIEQLGLAPTWEQRKKWMNILEQLGDNAQQKIIRALSDERWYLIRNLLTVLDKQLDAKSIKVVQQLFTHEHPRVRAEAIRILFTYNPATANRQLLTEFHSSDPAARLAAIEIAANSSDHRVIKLLHDILTEDAGDDDDLQLQISAINTLTEIGNNESLAIFNRLLRKQSLLRKRRLQQLQEEILRNLVRFPGASAKKLLQEQCQGKYKQIARELLEQKA